MNSKLVVGGIIVALVLSGLAFFGDGVGPKGDRGDRGKSGAISGPDLFSSYFAVNGNRRYYNEVAVNSGSSTLCAFIAPRGATTTLVAATLRLDKATTSNALLVSFWKGTQGATTTRIGNAMEILADNGGYITASSSDSAIDNDHLFVGSSNSDDTDEVLQVIAEGAVVGGPSNTDALGNVFSGRCTAIFQEI